MIRTVLSVLIAVLPVAGEPPDHRTFDPSGDITLPPFAPTRAVDLVYPGAPPTGRVSRSERLSGPLR